VSGWHKVDKQGVAMQLLAKQSMSCNKADMLQYATATT
jgi:hypothetical protein